VISEATRVFAEATTDYERLLGAISRILTDVIADSCAVFLLDEERGLMRPVAIHSGDPVALGHIQQSLAAQPLLLNEQPALSEIVRTGQSLLAPELDQQAPRSDTTPEQVAAQRKFGLHSYLAVALRSRERVVGVVTMGRFRPTSPPFNEEDRELAQTLAEHASLALENARLYAQSQEARVAAERAERAIRVAEQAQAAQRESEARLQRTVDSMLEGYTILGRDLRYLYVNAAAARQARLPKEQLIGRTPMELYPEFEKSGMYALLQRCLRTNAPVQEEEELTLADGTKGYFEVYMQPTSEGLVVLSMDTTERRHIAQAREALEEQLRQSQRMDAVGRLAGGVAHDFNNLLMVILSYTENVSRQLPAGDALRADIDEAHKAARRAAELTKQLLMFSRQQVQEPKILDLNEVFEGMERLLRRVLGEHLELVTAFDRRLGKVRADRGNMEQVIMNLVVNARDAMPTGGRLTLTTSNVELDQKFVRSHLGAEPGPYVRLTVTDTGAGMDKATRLRIFEPFFTTKEQGKGTGLGLSTVFGIVKQSGGGVWVSSEPGHGSSFEVYLPRVEGSVDKANHSAVVTERRGSETILLVEDEEAVRVVAQRILERSGYRVLVARDGESAIRLREQHVEPIQLLLTDVVMPRMSGAELAARLAERWPETRVLYMSGYADGSVVSSGALRHGDSFLQKPFTSDVLVSRVRKVLDGSQAAE
jgi:PAS domain S-box-containing protein